MKIKNPNFVSDVDKFLASNKVALKKVFSDKATRETLTAEDVRAALPTIRDQLTDGMIAEFAKREGMTLEE
ncbi:hypothetical protein SAMN05216428_102439 [Nitrosospira sp. Nsp11]|uniref:hypothetical protein n=1 Tax=Nitrosospira sp. Nsp11 TaxID=1855338 RepID=UPI00091ABC20|nr:hypothetical protein [Nitrosospira sp. Nsp11]SHL44919.1 hypothetical protein SAMN05216428_102439 [Nitrosospira sp. Nsp11]